MLRVLLLFALCTTPVQASPILITMGDSNTFDHLGTGWPSQLQTLLPSWDVRWAGEHIYAGPGSRASDDPGFLFVFPISSHPYVEWLFDDMPPVPLVVMLAWGTNDIGSGHTAAETAAALDVLHDWLASPYTFPIIATIPRIMDPAKAWMNPLIDETNALLVSTYGDCLVDFYAATPTADPYYMPDGVHFTDDGHAARASEAMTVLGELLERCT